MKFSDLMTIVDYFEFRDLAIAEYPECQLELFFKHLNKIRLKILSNEEKHLLAQTYLTTVVTDSIALSETIMLEFINVAIQIKHQLGIDFFLHLLPKELSPSTQTCSDYIHLAYLFLELKVESISSQFRPGDWRTMLKTYQKLKKNEGKITGPPTDIIHNFLTKTSILRFPLPETEVLDIGLQYQQLMNFIMEIKDITPIELHARIRSLQEKLSIKHIPEVLSDEMLQTFALITMGSQLCFEKFPYPTQIFSILAMLKNPKGRLLQIRTGEGKSLSMAILAAFLASIGFRIHIITSSKDLAIRDYEKNQAFFELLNIFCFHVCDALEDSAPLTQKILYGTSHDFEFLMLYDALLPESKERLPKNIPSDPCIALIDESDNLLIDTAGNAARIAWISSEKQTWFYIPIANFVRILGESFEVNKAILLELRTNLETYDKDAYARDYSYLTDKKLDILLKSAKHALFHLTRDIEYVVKADNIQIVDHSHTGLIVENSRWNNGLHQFLEIKEGLTVEAEDLTIASISHCSWIKHHYHLFYGMSGSLGSDIERQELEDIYGVDAYDVPTHKPCLREYVPPVYVATQTEHYAKLRESIETACSRHQPILLLFPNILASKAFSDYLSHAKIPHQCLNECQQETKVFVLKCAGQAGAVTIATNVASRGTDIILSEESIISGGLVTISTNYDENERVAAQRDGRSARQGQPGSCQHILYAEDDFIKKLIPEIKIRQALVGLPNFLEILDERRNTYILKLSKQRRLTAQRDSCLYATFQQFSQLLKEAYHLIGSISLEHLITLCNRLNPEILGQRKEQKSIYHNNPLFSSLIQVANLQISQQFHGLMVDWLPFLKKVKELYFMNMKEVFARFFSQITQDIDKITVDFLEDTTIYEKQLNVKFISEVVENLGLTTTSAEHAFLHFIQELLQAPENYFSMKDHECGIKFFTNRSIFAESKLETTLKKF